MCIYHSRIIYISFWWIKAWLYIFFSATTLQVKHAVTFKDLQTFILILLNFISYEKTLFNNNIFFKFSRLRIGKHKLHLYMRITFLIIVKDIPFSHSTETDTAEGCFLCISSFSSSQKVMFIIRLRKKRGKTSKTPWILSLLIIVLKMSRFIMTSTKNISNKRSCWQLILLIVNYLLLPLSINLNSIIINIVRIDQI